MGWPMGHVAGGWEAPPPPAQATGRAEIEVEATRELAPGRPWGRRNGPRASRAAFGGQDGSWLFLFPFNQVPFLLFFLTGGWPDYDRHGRSGAM